MNRLWWLGLSVLAGLVLGGLVVVTSRSSLSGPLVPLAFFVLLLLLLAGVPWLALRPSWLWWIASAAGSILGFAGGFLILVGLKVVSFCILPPCNPPPNAWRDALIFVAPLALMGLAQALTLRGGFRRIAWLATALAGAVVLPYGVVVAAALLGQNVNAPGPAPFLIGGILWGLVMGIGLGAPTSTEPA